MKNNYLCPLIKTNLDSRNIKSKKINLKKKT